MGEAEDLRRGLRLTESFAFVCVSPEGAKLGGILLPLNGWLSSAYYLTYDGTPCELHGTKAGVEVYEYTPDHGADHRESLAAPVR